jgi:hypothetical protein
VDAGLEGGWLGAAVGFIVVVAVGVTVFSGFPLDFDLLIIALRDGDGDFFAVDLEDFVLLLSLLSMSRLGMDTAVASSAASFISSINLLSSGRKVAKKYFIRRKKKLFTCVCFVYIFQKVKVAHSSSFQSIPHSK